MAIKRKKLYFLANFNAATAVTRVFPCTQFRSTESYTGDIYGGVLDDLAPLTNGSFGEKQRRNDVAAWVRLISGTVSTNFVSQYEVDFVSATTDAGAATILQTAAIKTAAGGTLGVDGITPILTRHFGVRVKREGSAAATGKVMVYVQRQHSIEV